MLPRIERLTKSREFAFIYRKRRSVANSLLILYVGLPKHDEAVPSRVGFVVGKKVSKRAVKRNRAKRLMRESYKNIRKAETFELKNYQNLIFIARPAIIEADYTAVNNAVNDCVKRAAKRFKLQQK